MLRVDRAELAQGIPRKEQFDDVFFGSWHNGGTSVLRVNADVWEMLWHYRDLMLVG